MRRRSTAVGEGHVIGGFGGGGQGGGDDRATIGQARPIGFPGEMEKFCTPVDMSDVDNPHTRMYLHF